MASKRLTENTRALFIRAVMNDVPVPDEAECSKEFQKILYASMPKCVQETFDLDPLWLARDTSFFYMSSNNGKHIRLNYKWHEEGSEIFPDEAVQYLKRLEKILEERDEFCNKLREIVNNVSTVKELKTIFPEFAKYAPDDTPAPTKNLPVCNNLMAEVIKLGWPDKKIVNAEIASA
jgi:hypothetical protein